MNIIISMASYEKRFPTLHLCLESIIKQSVKPNKFLLYLDRPYKNIPHRILEFQEKGMEICFAETDLKSHNKYFYAMQQYPDDILITLDDDVLYPDNLINILLETYKKYPYAVSAGRVHKMSFDNYGYIMPYDTWEKEAALYNKPSMDLLAIGVGGILYPPHCMDNRLFDLKKIQQFCLYGDDIWLKAMQLLKGTPVVAIQQEKQHPPIIDNTQQYGLHVINKLQHRNDLYIKNVFREYDLMRKDIKMNNIDISVIIPAHNTASYLKKCLNSMVNQTASNVEIIIVDDASEPPLKSLLYEEYKNYQNIVYLRNETPMRPGGARNRGIDVAHGRYITFCDSDDWVDLNYFEQIIKYMDTTMADIGMTSMMRNDDYSINPIYKCHYDRLYTLTPSVALKILSGSYDMGIKIVPACINKVYRREFIFDTNSRFEQDIYFQGILYSVYTFLRAKKIICIPDTTYHHYLRINSITQSFDRKHIHDFVECFTRMKIYFENLEKYEEYAFEYYRICEHYINVLVSELFEYIPNEKDKKTYLIEIIDAIKNVVNFDDYYKYITAEQLRHHIQPHVENTFDVLY